VVSERCAGRAEGRGSLCSRRVSHRIAIPPNRDLTIGSDRGVARG
jgi:hypothetical protein